MLHIDAKTILLLQAAVVVLVPFLIWQGFRLQSLFPLAVVQIFSGILLGPTLFGAAFPEAFEFLFAKPLLGGVDSVAVIAICFFAFMAGAEADKSIIAGAGRSVVYIGLGGLLLTWALAGAGGALLVEAGWPAAGPSVSIWLFAIAFGLAIAVPALPVLAAILNDMRLTSRRLGALALASTGLAEVVMWLTIAAIIPFATPGGDPLKAAALAFAGGALAVALCQFAATPALNRLLAANAPEKVVLIVAGVTVFAAASITHMVNLHGVLGAFIAGVFLPDPVRHMALKRLELPTAVLLMPFFFLSTGLTANFSLSDDTIWTVFWTGLFLCVFAKIFSTVLFARLAGENLAFGGAMGILLQTKGLMELVIATIFFQNGIISEQTFSAFVLVALVSTALTKPATVLFLKYFGREVEASGPAHAAPAEAPATAAPGVLAYISISDPVLLEQIGRPMLIEVREPSLTIGRHSKDGIQIPDLRVSRHHALLRQLADGRFAIANQTASRADPRPMTVNGVETEEATLGDGDEVALGGVRFKFATAH